MARPSVSDEEKIVRRRARQRARYYANREKILEQKRALLATKSDEERAEARRKDNARHRAWRAANPTRSAGLQLKYKYGLTREQFISILEAQSAACAICGVTDPGGRGSFCVDHCHSTGEVRGLLCNHCNTALGLFRDNTASLQRAIDYLSAARSKETLQ